MKSSIVALCLVAITSFQATQALPDFVSRIPNGNKVKGVAALGHINPAGDGARNAFGNAFDDEGKKWTATLCATDSDGDGQSNGMELGDPCCTWKVGDTPLYDAVSHPGDASKTANASLWANVTCTIPKTISASNTLTFVHVAATIASVIASALLL